MGSSKNNLLPSLTTVKVLLCRIIYFYFLYQKVFGILKYFRFPLEEDVTLETLGNFTRPCRVIQGVASISDLSLVHSK